MVEGEGRRCRVVLMPGLDGTGLLFAPFVACLPGDFDHTIVRYPADATASLESLADHTLRMAGPMEGTIVIAESFSSLVLLHLLGQRGVRPAAVVFVAGFAGPPRPWLLRLARSLPLARLALASPSWILRFFCLGPEAPAALVDLVRDSIRSVTPATLSHRLSLVAETSITWETSCPVPCLDLRPGTDRLVPATASRGLARLFLDFRQVRIPGPHFLLQAAPQACAAAVLTFVGSILRS